MRGRMAESADDVFALQAQITSCQSTITLLKKAGASNAENAAALIVETERLAALHLRLADLENLQQAASGDKQD